MRRIIASLALFVAVVLVPPVAAATATEPAAGAAPPGSSAVDQYRESVPRAPTSAGGDRSEQHGPSKTQRERLAQTGGQDGRDLAAVLEREGGGAASSTPAAVDRAPQGAARRSERPRTDGDTVGAANGETAAGRSGDATDDRAAVPAETAAASTLGAKLGPVPLWLLLVLVTASVLATVVLRRRSA